MIIKHPAYFFFMDFIAFFPLDAFAAFMAFIAFFAIVNKSYKKLKRLFKIIHWKTYRSKAIIIKFYKIENNLNFIKFYMVLIGLFWFDV